VHLSIILLDSMTYFQMLLLEISHILSHAFPSGLPACLYVPEFEPFKGGRMSCLANSSRSGCRKWKGRK